MVATLVAVVATVAAFVLLWTRTPDALQLTDRRPEPEAPNGRPEPKAKDLLFDFTKAGPSLRSGRQAVLRSLLAWNAVAFWAIVIAMAALGSDLGLVYFWIAVLTVSATVRTRARWLAALPLSHRARLLAIVVPTVVVTTCCVAIGAVAGRSLPFVRHPLMRDGPMPVEGGYDNRTHLS